MNKQTLPQFLVFAKRKDSQNPFADLYLRITFLKERQEKSMGIKCPYEEWNSVQMMVRNDPTQTEKIKEVFEEMKQKVMGAFYLFEQSDTGFSLDEIIQVSKGERKPGALSYLQSFNELITRMEKSKKHHGVSEANVNKHKVCYRHVQSFIKEHYNKKDLPYAKINKIFIEEFVDYLKGEADCSQNTAMKYLMIVKKVYRIGVDNGWIKVNAFANYKMKMTTVERDFLNEMELEILRNKMFEIPRLDFVKDLFVFSCFTGLAYVDVANLRRSNIVDNQGRYWIKNKRTKTGVEASVPLLSPARRIIEKWNTGWEKAHKEEFLFSVLSNQKMNAYLKEIADVCGIEKRITFHLARHTFATTVTLSNDIPLETVSKMLGHSRIAMTQHYSKVVDLKIDKDTIGLRNKFS